MSVTLALVLDDETAAYLQVLATGQGRTAEEVAALLVTDEVQREQAIDAELVTRFDHHVAGTGELADGSSATMSAAYSSTEGRCLTRARTSC